MTDDGRRTAIDGRRSTIDEGEERVMGAGRGATASGDVWRAYKLEWRTILGEQKTKNKKPETPWRGIRTIPACGLRTTTITSVLSIALWIDTLQLPLSDRIISTFCVTFRVHVIIGLVCSCTILFYTCDVSLITSISEYLSCKCLCFVLFSPSVQVCSFF